jgi:hypothetical protein
MVPIGERRDLREVRDTQHLPSDVRVAGEPSELRAHRQCGRASDARIDLVEDQHASFVARSEDDLEGEGDT